MDNSANMLQLCRLCLVKDEVNIPIFEEQGDIRQIFLKISSCLPVKVSREDKLPKKICDGCSCKLDMLYEFWNTSANAEKQLLSWLGEAGMSAKMNDGHMSAVAQQIKPNETLVKEEELDPSDLQKEEDDDDEDDEEKSYMFQQKLEENNAGPSATATSNEEEEQEQPPPKRARRTAAVKAAIAMDHDSDDDDDSGEPLTKVEDESEDSDCEDAEPAFVDAPSTSADDQPGPSGVGKDGADAPSSHSIGALQAELKKYNITRELRIILNDLKYNENLLFDGNKYIYLNDARRKTFTCYVCMEKFRTKYELGKHKHMHAESDVEDDFVEEDYNPESPPTVVSSGKKIVGSILPPLTKLSNVSAQNTDVSPSKTDTTTKTTAESSTISCDRNETPFRCTTCNVFFVSADDAKLHITTSIKCKFACRLCNRKFNTLYAFVVHLMQHKTNTEKVNSKSTYSCSLCQKTFDDCFSLKRHGINTHNIKTETAIQPKPQIVTSQPVDKVPQDTQEDSRETEQLGDNEYTCELCYDIFKTIEELTSHTEFHKQLEMNSEPIIIDDDDEFVEVVEDVRDKHEIITTIQKADKMKVSNRTRTTFVPIAPAPAPTSSDNTSQPSTTYKLPKLSHLQSNQVLSAKIKKMLEPNSKKVSKTILLPTPVEGKSKKRRKIKQISILKKKQPLVEVQKTGPLSYSVVYKDDNASSTSTNLNTTPVVTNVSTPQTPHSANLLPNLCPITNPSALTSLPSISTSCTTTNTLPNVTYIVNDPAIPTNATPTQPCINFGDTATQYAYVIIPHNNQQINNSSSMNNVITPSFTEALLKAINANNLSNEAVPTVQSEVSDKDHALTQPKETPTTASPSMPLITEVTSLATDEINTGTTSSTTTVISEATETGESLLRKSLTTIPESATLPFPKQVASTSLSLPNLQTTSTSDSVVPTETILIDSDSSSSSIHNEESTVDKNLDETEFLDNLVIDETVGDNPIIEDTNNEEQKDDCALEGTSGADNKDSNAESDSKDTGGGDPPKMGTIFVKKMEDLLAPKVLEKVTQSANKKWKFPIKCTSCSFMFQKYRTMRIHNQRKHKCFNCDYRCCKIMDLKSHYKTEHQLFLCRICKFLTDSLDDSETHHSTHVCQSCAGVFADMANHTCSDVPKAKKSSN